MGTFRDHPRRGGRTLASRVLIVLDEAGQPEVGDFAAQGVRHEDVGGPQVAVDVVLGLNEGHALRDLPGQEP